MNNFGLFVLSRPNCSRSIQLAVEIAVIITHFFSLAVPPKRFCGRTKVIGKAIYCGYLKPFAFVWLKMVVLLIFSYEFHQNEIMLIAPMLLEMHVKFDFIFRRFLIPPRSRPIY